MSSSKASLTQSLNLSQHVSQVTKNERRSLITGLVALAILGGMVAAGFLLTNHTFPSFLASHQVEILAGTEVLGALTFLPLACASIAFHLDKKMYENVDGQFFIDGLVSPEVSDDQKEEILQKMTQRQFNQLIRALEKRTDKEKEKIFTLFSNNPGKVMASLLWGTTDFWKSYFARDPSSTALHVMIKRKMEACLSAANGQDNINFYMTFAKAFGQVLPATLFIRAGLATTFGEELSAQEEKNINTSIEQECKKLKVILESLHNQLAKVGVDLVIEPFNVEIEKRFKG